MRTLEAALQLRLSKHDGMVASVPILVDGQRVRISSQKAFALVGMFGVGDITVTGEDAFDALAILHERFPRWMFSVGRHLRLIQPVMPSTWYPRVVKRPCHKDCNRKYLYYVFALTLPHCNFAPYSEILLTEEFLSNPELPDFQSHIPEWEYDRITYFIHKLPARRAELRRWMLLHSRQLVGILQNIRKAYGSFRLYWVYSRTVPLLPAKREYRAFVAQTLGEWCTVGGSELMAALRNQGGLPFMVNAGLPFIGNSYVSSNVQEGTWH